MAIRDVKGEIDDRIPVRRVLLSVFDKSGLDQLVIGLVQQNPGILLLSTGGTYKTIGDVLGEKAIPNLREVAQYTGFPEMEGGLVKTLHPKIHAGLLGERHNPEHQKYLHETLTSSDAIPADYIDMVVVNLYPFEQVVSKPGTTFEQARGNIDIGGPTMVRAAAKNFMSCAVVVDPNDYPDILSHIKKNNGCTTFNMRIGLMQKAFNTTAEYERQIAYHMKNIGNPGQIRSQYKIADRGE